MYTHWNWFNKNYSGFILIVDAIRIIKAGGVYLNHVRVMEPDCLLTFGQEILPNYITLLRIGKYLTRVNNFVFHGWDLLLILWQSNV